MKKIYEDFWQTSLENPLSGLNTHTCFLQRSEGNVLFYTTSNLDDIDEISKLGGTTRRYMLNKMVLEMTKLGLIFGSE